MNLLALMAAFQSAVPTSYDATFLPSTIVDNAFNHPQFSVGLGTGGFMDLTDYLLGGDLDNGATAVPDADTVGSPEGFSVGRVIRVGLRLRF